MTEIRYQRGSIILTIVVKMLSLPWGSRVDFCCEHFYKAQRYLKPKLHLRNKLLEKWMKGLSFRCLHSTFRSVMCHHAFKAFPCRHNSSKGFSCQHITFKCVLWQHITFKVFSVNTPHSKCSLSTHHIQSVQCQHSTFKGVQFLYTTFKCVKCQHTTFKGV